MNKQICQKCGGVISNDFGEALFYCTNCGTNLTDLQSNKTSAFNENSPLQPQTTGRRSPTIFLTVLLASLFFILCAVGLYLYLPRPQSERGGDESPEKTNLSPRPRSPSSVSAADVLKITYSTWQHRGSLHSGDGYVESAQIVFSSDGTASQTRSKKYDDGNRPEEISVFSGTVTDPQFRGLAEAVVENDFFNELDSKERISEGGASLSVRYPGGAKEVKTSNVGRDTVKITAILRVFNNLQSEVLWKKEK